MNDCIPNYVPGGTITGHCSAAVTGKRFVKVTGDKQGADLGAGLDADALGGNYVVGPVTTLGERVLGVAKRDTASGGKVGVYSDPGLILPVKSGAAINQWQEVMTDATGQAIPYAVGAGRYAVGVAMAACASGADCEVKLYGIPALGAAA